MKLTVKCISILLSVLFVISIAACASGTVDNTKESETAESSTVSTDLSASDTAYYEDDDLPELDFGGQTVYILSPGSVDDGFSFWETTFTVEELNSSVLNDSIYNRELYVEDRLGIEIENVKILKAVDREIEKLFAADDDTYDAVISTNTFISECAIDKYLTDLYTVDNLDLDKPWWSQNFSEAAELFGSLYMCTGSLFVSLIRSTNAMYYNKNLAQEFSSSTPELLDLYNIVDSGDWTYDKLVEFAGELYIDDNGNTIRDTDDIYGISFNSGLPLITFWSGFDIDVFSKTEDGWFEFNVDTDKLYNSLEMICNLLHECEGSLTAKIGTTDEAILAYGHQLDQFSDGKSLFLLEKIGRAESERFRNMKDDYGILPHPKYDKNQKNYYSFPDTSFCAVAIPKMNTSPEIVGAVLEAMASYSYRQTMPLYLDTVLKGQYMSDPESRHMIDIVVDGIIIDPAWIYIDTLANRYPAKYSEQLPEGNGSYINIHESNSKKLKLTLSLYKNQLLEG